MSSYLNNLLTNTTSRYNNLRRQILSDEADGDTEDDSHLSRVLRAYYTEKGRPFPQWLPPDPKAPQAAPPAQFAASSLRQQQGQAPQMGRGGGGLSDLWDSPAPQQQAQEPLSLRRGAGGRGGGARPLQGRPMGNSLTPEPQIQGRPLPSQRAGSYQSSLGGRPAAEASPPPSAGGGTSAQERLKARLWGRSQSPAPRGMSSDSVNSSPAGGRAPYPDERSNSYGSAGSAGGRQQADAYAPQAGGYGGGAPQRTPQAGQAPPSPTASFYDLSDDEEGEYNTIRHTSSGKGVYVHPSPSSKDNIPGFVALIQQKPNRAVSDARPTSSSSARSANASSLLLCWLPESNLGDAYDTYVKVDLSDSSSPPKQSYLVPPPPTPSTHAGTPGYAFALPVSEIYSVLIRPPSIGWWFGSVVINTRAGDSFPALFFHDSECQSTIMQRKKLAKESFDPFSDGGGMFWGGDEVLRWLKRYVTVERSGADPSIYLIDPSEDDKKSFGKDVAPRKSTEGQASSSQQGAKRDGGMDPVTKALKEARWNFLEKLSQVTTFTRRTAQAVVDNPKLPPQVKRLIQNPEVQTLQDEFDSARLYLARWAMGIAEQSERERNQRIWTAKDVLAMEESDVGDFEILDMDKMTMADRRKPVTLTEWKGFFDPKGRLQLTPDEVKDRIFHGGLDPDDGVRKEAWLFLLGVYDWDSSDEERRAHLNSLRDEYIRLKGAWWERMAEGEQTEEQEEWWREQKNRIDRNIPIFAGEDIPHPDPDSPFADVGTNVHLEQMKDMLLTYNEYNKGLGYVQGMSDLLAPIYAVMQDDAVAFWGFVGFMGRMERNFLRDQSGMRRQLLTLDHLVQLMDPKLYLHLQSADSTNFFFFFRMLLVWYKREFEWADVLRLWESLWTDYQSSNFHIFIALAILEKHKEIIMAHLKHFDEVLKYVNELSGTMDLESTLVRAESLFKRFQRTVETIDKKGNFPSAPQARQRKLAAALVAGPGRSSPGSSSKPQDQATTSGTDKGKQVGEDDQEEARVISPELRALLSRKVEMLDKETILEHGGGVGK
ncbi:GTPase-activating protein-like protein gyp7 [Stemphylium lycopersici]|nr:GTPase-activating protein-like protein gyp7 [Stemphylium lycopersici]